MAHIRYIAIGLLAVASAIGMGAPARAMVAPADDPHFGPGSIVVDLTTGYQWLSPQFSRNRSIADVSSHFGSGGDFEGFRYATQAELTAFWQSAGLSVGFGFPTAPYETFLSLMGGPTEANASVQRIVSYVSTQQTPGAYYAPDVGVFFGAGFANPNNCCVSVTQVFPQSGSWLVRNRPPTANAGAGFSVDEGQAGVTLDGRASFDPDGDALTYAWVQVGGTTIALSGAATATPSFTAPYVPSGGETLSFKLTVTATGGSSTDTVDVTVVNVNHPPVADAGADQSVAEGSPVTLHGELSFDIDNDPFAYSWVQVGGPLVTLTGADTANPTFVAPYVGTGGAPGVVATLVFQLTVDDGFPPDAPAPGYTFGNIVDTVTVDITNVNNAPTAAAGANQTVNEHSLATLSGTASSDPDGDPLTYAWTQVGGPTVALSGAATATPSFTAPFVSAGGAALEFELTVADGYGGTATDRVVVHVQNINDPPLAAAARPTLAVLWPPNHGLVAVGITGVSDPNNNATITITAVTQDEPTGGLGDGDTAVDAIINADGTVLLRAERSGAGDGRVYHIHFTASDFEGSSSGVVTVSVPHSAKEPAIDGGPLFDSTN